MLETNVTSRYETITQVCQNTKMTKIIIRSQFHFFVY